MKNTRFYSIINYSRITLLFSFFINVLLVNGQMLSNNKTINSLNNSAKFEKQTWIQEDSILIHKVDSVVNEINLKINNNNKQLANVNSEISKLNVNQISTRCKIFKDVATNYTLYSISDDENLIKLLTKSNATNFYNYYKNYILISFDDPNKKDELMYFFVFFNNETWDRISKYVDLDLNFRMADADFKYSLIPSGLFKKSLSKNIIQEIQKSSNEEYLSTKFEINSMACGLIDEKELLMKDSINLSKNKQDLFGYTYIGQYKNKLRDGYGVLINLFQDTIFKGIWKNDLMLNGSFYAYNENKHGNVINGLGCVVYDNGSVYVGELNNSKANGKGEFYSRVNNAASSKYIKGNWSDNKVIPSQYVEQSINELKKENDYSKVVIRANGDFLILSKTNSKDGYVNVFSYWIDGSIFFGKKNDEYKDGITYWTNGAVYIGTDEINSPNIDGVGKFIYKNGEVRSGQFIDSKLHSLGTIISANGKITEGYYEKGVLVQTIEQFEKEQKDLDAKLRQRSFEREQERESYPERECASCNKVFCCVPGYEFDENGQISIDKNHVTYYCSSDCAKKGFNKLDDMYNAAKRANQYKNEKCDHCYGNGTVNCFNNFGEIQKCRCTSCNGTGKKYN